MKEDFNFYTPQQIAQVRLVFSQLIINSSEDGNRFFEAYCPGNTIDIIDRPYERFEDYENFLKIIREDDQVKYEIIHKGTPFYFLAWSAFDLKNYEKAVFYMDAAISEDKRKDPRGWLENPAGRFLTLNHQDVNQSAKRITKFLSDKISAVLSRFNSITGNSPISVDNFVDKFVKKLVVEKKENNSIITAFYSYILEFDDREKELSLRSTEGGSIEPTLTYLFKGGLIFESLLKYFYPKQDNGSDYRTLKDIFNTADFKSDFITITDISASKLKEIVDAIGGNDLLTAFIISSKLRNTAGHNLVWDDVFNESDNFKKLYEQQVNAILYLIQKKFLNP